ncbi:hypothetical protein FRB94_007825 [Tulasnella sp. JGI-2019a]|nr:hypothetical protein FRB94_007825 [Tulasnella sp. JGI-2019a]KAG9027681.1 hypothetical protein FRB95_007452 [Tulasnella sp. JGI-2019a]
MPSTIPPPPPPPPPPPDASQSYFQRSQLTDALFAAVMGVCVIFFGGVVYVNWYKANVLRKMEIAFEPGADPALLLANHGLASGSVLHRTSDDLLAKSEVNEESLAWVDSVRRDEQAVIDSIMHGKEHGHYFLIMGPKGVGKGTMIFEAMRKVDADGVAICEAHEDLEVFRLRLGKALNYEYNEDSQTGLFQRRDPREGGPRLDIERALNKLEKVALRLAPKRKKPLVLVINNIQVFNNNEESQHLLIQLQQRAEAWAESGIVTMVFNTDDFWPWPLLRRIGNRMQVVSIYDLDPQESMLALRHLRWESVGKVEPRDVLHQALNIAGGRLSLLNRIARSHDPLSYANNMLETEKGWLLSQIGLIPDCDDDVMDEQKVCASSWLLLYELVKQYRQTEKDLQAAATDGKPVDAPLPAIPYYKARQIMTRADFLEKLDNMNVISIDTNHMVRPDSMVILRAAINVVEEEGFEEMLNGVRARIDEIESLHRTAELTWKASSSGDLLRVYVEKKPPPKPE